jgi:hypothetical protein
MPDTVAYRLDWHDRTAWVECGGSMPGRKHPASHHETFTSPEEAEARRAALARRAEHVAGLTRPQLVPAATVIVA